MDPKFYSKLVCHIENYKSISSLDFNVLGFKNHCEASLALKALEGFGDVFEVNKVKIIYWSLTLKGKEVVKCSKVKNDGSINRTENYDILQDLLKIEEGFMNEIDENSLLDYQKQNYILKCELDGIKVLKGEGFSSKLILSDDLTADMLPLRLWENVVLSSYDNNKKGSPIKCVSLHPVYNFLTDVRQALFEMGFREVAAPCFVETISSVRAEAEIKPEDAEHVYSVSVCSCHLCSSLKKYFLRTGFFHSLLSEIAALKSRPGKLFTIGKVFQNKLCDDLEVPESHELELMVSDVELNFSHILGICCALFSRIGVVENDFKQSYFPHTTLTVGIYLYNEVLDSWISVGKGGIVRPESIKEFGMNEELTVMRLQFCLERVLLNIKECGKMSQLIQ